MDEITGGAVVRSVTSLPANASGNKSYLVIAGPTGSGKSALGLALAQAMGGEIVNCDSVQVYRGFDIGAAKATSVEQKAVPHHLLDIVEADQSYDAAVYAAAAHRVKAEIMGRGKLPIVVGGTGLYLRALLGQGWHSDLPQDQNLREELSALPTPQVLEELQRRDPKRAKELHPNDRVRLLRSLELVRLLGKPLDEAGLTGDKPRDPTAYLIVLEPPRALLHKRIQSRTIAMLDSGLIAEVQRLLSEGVSPNAKPMQSIGYKQVCAYLHGQLQKEQVEGAIIAATRQYAKRQCTWFRRLATDLRLNGDESLSEVITSIRSAFA